MPRRGFAEDPATRLLDIESGYRQATSRFDKPFLERQLGYYKDFGLSQKFSDFQNKSDRQLYDVAAKVILAQRKSGLGGSGGGGSASSPAPGPGPKPPRKSKPTPKPKPMPKIKSAPKPKPAPKPKSLASPTKKTGITIGSATKKAPLPPVPKNTGTKY